MIQELADVPLFPQVLTQILCHVEKEVYRSNSSSRNPASPSIQARFQDGLWGSSNTSISWDQCVRFAMQPTLFCAGLWPVMRLGPSVSWGWRR